MTTAAADAYKGRLRMNEYRWFSTVDMLLPGLGRYSAIPLANFIQEKKIPDNPPPDYDQSYPSRSFA
jgi:hypothetical protein